MDERLQRKMRAICILAAAQRGDAYAYQLLKEVSALLPLSETALYQLLQRLLQAQYLSEYSAEYQGRQRKYYRLTAAGRQHLAEFLDEWGDMMRLCQYVREGQENG